MPDADILLEGVNGTVSQSSTTTLNSTALTYDNSSLTYTSSTTYYNNDNVTLEEVVANADILLLTLNADSVL